VTATEPSPEATGGLAERQRRIRPSLGRELVAVSLLILSWSTLVQWPSRSIGLFYDDFLVFRHYSAGTVLRSWWGDLATLTSPELWVHAYRPMTLLVHALTYEVFGFRPDSLLGARILMGSGIAICLYVWVRSLGVSRGTAFFCAVLFLAFPANFYAFTWNTEIGAISSLVWLLLSWTLATRYLQERTRARYLLSCLCWTLALLTKEVVVPLVVVFPVLWLLYGRHRRWKDGLSFSLSFLVLTSIYVAIRFIVLRGSWGAQGLSPDRGGSLAAYGRNYIVYLAWMGYDLPVRLARNHRLIDLPRLDVLVLIAPVVSAGIELIRSARGLARGALLASLRHLEPAQKQLWLGAAVTLAGGLICCFLPIPRIMFAAALGPVLLVGGLPYVLRKSAGLRTAGVTVACALVLGVNGLWYSDLIHDKYSDFERVQKLEYVESYFTLGHLFDEWGLREQAHYLRDRLVDADLVDAGTGQLRPDTFREYLTSLGVPERDAAQTIRRLQSLKGADPQ
jgi:hypothetical protein